MLIRTADDIGAAIFEARRRRRLTQVDLAAQAGVTSRWLREVEHGKPTAEIGLVLRVIAFLGLEIDLANPADRKPSASADEEYPDIDNVIARMLR